MENAVLWTAEQHALIGAMGLSVYAHVDVQPWPAPVAPPAFENLAPGAQGQPLPDGRPPRVASAAQHHRPLPVGDMPPAPAPAAEPASPPARPLRQAPPPPRVTADSRPVPPRRPRGGLLSAMPDRLMLALLRASKLNPADPATQGLMASWPLEVLRADPAAKRALWPQLRRLRKQRQER